MIPKDWDRIFCHPSKVRLLRRLLAGEVGDQNLNLLDRPVTLIVDSTVPLNGLLIGSASRVIPLFGLIETINSIRDRIRGINKGDHHDSYTDRNPGNLLQR